MDKHLPSRHSGASRNPVPSSDIYKNNQINELDPGFRRGDERGNQAVMNFSQTLTSACDRTPKPMVRETFNLGSLLTARLIDVLAKHCGGAK